MGGQLPLCPIGSAAYGYKCISVPNFVEIVRTAAEICELQFSIMLVWLENAYSRPFWFFEGGG